MKSTGINVALFNRMKNLLLTLVLCIFGAQASARSTAAMSWMDGREECYEKNVSTPLFQLYFELEKSGKCIYMKAKREHALILHDIPGEKIESYQTPPNTFPFETFRICRDNKKPKMMQNLLKDLQEAGIIKYRNGLFTNLPYRISRGLRRQDVYQNGIFFYSLPRERHCKRVGRTEAGRLEVLTHRREYTQESKDQYWKQMQLYWDLLEVFEKHGEKLEEYDLTPEELNSTEIEK